MISIGYRQKAENIATFNNNTVAADVYDRSGFFSGVSKYEKIWTFIFYLVVFALLLHVPGTAVLKYIALPLCLIMLYKTNIFDYLIFPISFTENVIGTIFFGKFTLIWFYFPLLLVKWFVLEKKKAEMTLPYFLIFMFFSVYQAIAASDYRMNSLKSVIFVFISILIAQECQVRNENYKRVFWVILLSSLMQALSLAFSLTGVTMAASGRTTGVGFSDPNYSSFIVLIGLCILLNMDSATLFQKAVRIVGCLICCLAVFRSGSRAGMLTGISLILLRVLLLKGVREKTKYFLSFLLVLGAVWYLISSGIIKISNYDLIMNRLLRTIAYYNEGDLTRTTAGRSDIAAWYLNYCFSRKFFGILFGGTVVASSSLLASYGHVTHNVYLDYLLAFGVVGTVFFFGDFFKRAWGAFSLYRKTTDTALLILTEIKACMLVFGLTLAMLQVRLWWFLFLL